MSQFLRKSIELDARTYITEEYFHLTLVTGIPIYNQKKSRRIKPASVELYAPSSPDFIDANR